MLKLTEAKCPSCGAKLEVNPKLEKTICQYCGNTVFIEEAIQKIKLEVSGKVEVEGIKGRNTKLKQALKHKKIKEYEEAHDLLEEIIEDDSFDIEVLCEIIKLDIDNLENKNFDETSTSAYDWEGWLAVNEIIIYNNRLKEIDENKESVPMLKDYKDKIEHYIEVSNKLDKDNSEFDEYVIKIKEHHNKLSSIDENCIYEWYDLFADKMGYERDEAIHIDSLEKIRRDGALEIHNFYKILPITKYNSKELLKKNLDEFLEISNQFIEDKKNEVNIKLDKANKEIDSNNKKTDKLNKKIKNENTVINLKIKFCYLKIILYSLIILFFIGFTIFDFFHSGFKDMILVMIIVDSWAITLPGIHIKKNITKIKEKKEEIENNQKYIEKNIKNIEENKMHIEENQKHIEDNKNV